jgi:hypothetical protein
MRVDAVIYTVPENGASEGDVIESYFLITWDEATVRLN